MSDKVYKKIEIVGTSEKDLTQAIRNGLDRAGQSVRHIDWFEVQNIRGAVVDGKPQFQVEMKIGFRLEE